MEQKLAAAETLISLGTESSGVVVSTDHDKQEEGESYETRKSIQTELNSELIDQLFTDYMGYMLLPSLNF